MPLAVLTVYHSYKQEIIITLIFWAEPIFEATTWRYGVYICSVVAGFPTTRVRLLSHQQKEQLSGRICVKSFQGELQGRPRTGQLFTYFVAAGLTHYERAACLGAYGEGQ